MMSRTATYFADSEIIEYYQKHVAEKAREYQSKTQTKFSNCKKKETFKLHIVNCYTLVVVLCTKGYQIMYYFSQLNRSISCHFIMFRIYIRKTSWK